MQDHSAKAGAKLNGDLGDQLRPSKTSLLLAAILSFATANALSFFVQNDYPWQRLTGDSHGLLITRQRLDFGVPLTVEFLPLTGIIEERFYWALAGNVCVALAISTMFALMFGRPSTQAVDQIASDEDSNRSHRKPRHEPLQLRFNLRQMIVLTTIVAALLGMFVRAPDQILRAIKFLYLAGPCIVVWTFFALQRRRRAATIVGGACAIALAVVAGLVGERHFGDFTFALFGVFVCWTPQLAAIALAALLAQAIRRQGVEVSNR